MKNENLTEAQIPALLGLPVRQSNWTLWHNFREDYVLTPPAKTMAEKIHPIVVEWVMENSEFIFGTLARKPNRAAQRIQHLPLQTTPDLVIEDKPAYGNGCGGVTVSHINFREWRKYWHPGSHNPKPPAWINASAQASMMASNTEWHAVLPIIGLDNPKAPIIIEANQDTQQEIQKHIVDFFRSVQDNAPPPPDYKAGRDIMNMLARDSSSRRLANQTPIPLPEEKAQELRPAMERYDELINLHAKSSEDTSNFRKAIQDIEVTLAETVAVHGPFSIDGQSVNVRSEDRQPVLHEPVTSVYVERDPTPEAVTDNKI